MKHASSRKTDDGEIRMKRKRTSAASHVDSLFRRVPLSVDLSP
jgi:hypothetical protein